MVSMIKERKKEFEKCSNNLNKLIAFLILLHRIISVYMIDHTMVIMY
jgi:hypothetical protein